MFKQLFVLSLIFGCTISIFGQSPKRVVSFKDTITDRELVVPDDIERNFDQLLVDWKKEMEESNNCTSSYDGNVTYPDSVYINRLYSLPTVMELVYNPVVRSYIDMYTGRMRSSVAFFLGKSDYYFPIFEQALDKYGLPLELKYLPIIESALNPTIVSRAGATGLWQFMLGTGKMYDLEINSLVDERRDPYRSTDAAARYLRDLYNIYGDWNLVIAAYNCGPGNVNKAIKRNGGESDYWSIYPFLPKETRGYVPAFIAATYVMNYADEHNICSTKYVYNSSTDTIAVDKYLHFQQLSDVLDVPIEDIRTLNPQFKKDIVPGEFKVYTLKLPSESASDFIVNKDSVYSYKSNELLTHRKVVEPSGTETSTTLIKHKVRKGESLSAIATKHKVTTKQIRRWNHMKSNRVQTGQVLAIQKKVVKPKEQPKTEPAETKYYAQNSTDRGTSVTNTTNNESVDDRESLAPNMLSDYFKKQSQQDVTSNTIIRSNLGKVIEDNDTIGVSQETRTPNEPQTIYHKVRIGETVALIASKYNVDRDDLVKWNKLKSTVPKIGQRLVIHLPAATEVEEEQEEIDPSDIEEITVLNDSSANRVLADNQESSLSSDTVRYRNYGPSPAIAATLPSKKEVHEVQSVTPKKEKPKVEPKATQPKAKKPKTTIYTVKKGDTLGSIAAKMGKVTSKDIMSANRLKSDKLKIGQKLKIPR